MTPDTWCTADRHGDRRAYSAGCRCSSARRAVSAQNARTLRRRVAVGPAVVDSTGTRRRIQALVASGWAYHALAREAYWPVSFLGTLATNPRPVKRVTAQRVTDLYDRLEYTPGPSRPAAVRARRKGWATPDQWIGDIDNPATRPVGADYTPPAVAPIEDIELLAECGATWESASGRLGTNQKALERRLCRLGRNDLYHRFSANSERYNPNPNRNQWSA